MIHYRSSFLPILLLAILAMLGPFFFPVPFAIIFGIFAAFFFPPVAIVVGGLLDALYTSGTGLHAIPYFAIFGVITAIGAAFVHDFVKTRIIS